MKASLVLVTALAVATTACTGSPVAPDAATVITPAATGASLPAVTAGPAGTEPHVYSFTTKPGELVNINLPSATGGGGFVGPLYEAKHGRRVGEFITDILSSEGRTIFEVLADLADGFEEVAAVRGTFVTQNGTIVDQHAASLQVVGPASTVGYDIIVVATADGIVTEGSGAYGRGEDGSSDLSLTMEVDLDGGLPARALDASFVFRLD